MSSVCSVSVIEPGSKIPKINFQTIFLGDRPCVVSLRTTLRGMTEGDRAQTARSVPEHDES